MGEFRPNLVSALVLFHVIDYTRSPGVHLVSTLTILYSYEKFLELPIKIPLRKFFSVYCSARNFVKKIDSMVVLLGNHWTFFELLRLTFLKFRLEILKHKTILNYKSIQKSVRFLYKKPVCQKFRSHLLKKTNNLSSYANMEPSFWFCSSVHPVI